MHPPADDDRDELDLHDGLFAPDPERDGENAERASLLEEAAIDAGNRWAAARRDELVREGRPVEGGWPGTLPEARVRVAAHAGRALTARAMSALTYDELGHAARVTYGEARRSWLAMPRPKRRRGRPAA